MGKILYITLVTLLVTSCVSPDPREADFSLDYDKYHPPYILKFEEGEITNISSNPADNMVLRVNKYTQFGLFASSERIRIKEGINPNETKEFCVYLADSVTKIKIQLVKVE